MADYDNGFSFDQAVSPDVASADAGPSNDYGNPFSDVTPANADDHPFAQMPVAPGEHVGGQSTSKGAPLLDYDTFNAQRKKAIKDWAYQNTGLLGHLGLGQEAAESYADATAPAKYAAYRQQHAAAQSAELGVAQDVGYMNANGANVNPDNIPDFARQQFLARQAAAQAATQQQAPQQQQTQPNTAAAPTPQSGAPDDPGVTPQGAPVSTPVVGPRGPVRAGGTVVAQPGQNPADAQRAFFMRTGQNMLAFPKFAQEGAGFIGAAQKTAPPGTIVTGDGVIRDANTGATIGPQSTQQYAAQGAGLTANAEQGARAAAQKSIDTHKAEVEGQNKLVTGFDATTGEPTAVTEYQATHGVKPNFVQGANPALPAQTKELEELRTSAQTADTGLQLAQQVHNAANGIYTGKGAEAKQDVYKVLQGVAKLTGNETPDSINKSVSQFEQLKYASQQLVAKAARDVNPRAAALIYNKIDQIKPGDKTSIQGLRDIIANELVPMLAREKAIFGATTSYYQAHPTARDAAAHVPDQLPVNNFSVKSDLGKVRPGDYFIDPKSGNLRQRPVQ